MYALSNDHSPALYQMNTGQILPGHPSMGSWVTYGLGTENQNLPAYVVFTDWRGGPIGGAPNWATATCPLLIKARRSGLREIRLSTCGPPAGLTPERQRKWLDLLGKLNEEHLKKNPDDSELSARIAAHELAFRMQTSAVEAVAL